MAKPFFNADVESGHTQNALIDLLTLFSKNYVIHWWSMAETTLEMQAAHHVGFY